MKRVRHCFVPFIALAAVTLACTGTAQMAGTPDALKQQLQRGAEALQRGDAAAAESTFHQVVATAPALPEGYLGLGMAQLRQGKPEDAIHSLEHAAQLNARLS